MTDSVQVFAPGERLFTSGGDPLAGGSIEFYDAGTTNAKTVYSDSGLTTSLGTVVHLDSGGHPVNQAGGSTKVMVYVGTAAYKVIIKDSSGNVVATLDNIRGAFDSASILETLTLIPETAVETLTAANTLTAADVGQLKNCNTTGGTFTVTLPDATALANGARIGLRMAGTANQLRIAAAGSQTIGRAGATSTAFSLTRTGETVWLVADGGNWLLDTYVPPLLSTTGVILIAARLSTPPGSPTAGARYIVTASPTGAWSSYNEHDIAEANGQGGWFRYQPATDCGWLAYVQDEDEYYFHAGTAWQRLRRAPTDTTPGVVAKATQAQIETATDDERYVPPARMKYHPGVAKFWAFVTYSGGVPTLTASYNVTSVTDVGQGLLGITIDVDFSSANWACLATLETSASTPRLTFLTQGQRTAGFVQVEMRQGDGTLVDPTSISVLGFGDQ
jgi:hypothetical protein